MGQKDHVIGYMGRRIGELITRCETLAKMVNDGLTAQRRGEAELRTEREQHAELRRQAAEHGELKQRYDQANEAIEVLRDEKATLARDLAAVQRQVGAKAPVWPGFGTVALAQDTTIEVGVSYVSPHLVGEWRCTGRDSAGTFFLTRQGAPDGRGAPTIRTVPIGGAGDAPLYLTEAPF